MAVNFTKLANVQPGRSHRFHSQKNRNSFLGFTCLFSFTLCVNMVLNLWLKFKEINH